MISGSELASVRILLRLNICKDPRVSAESKMQVIFLFTHEHDVQGLTATRKP